MVNIKNLVCASIKNDKVYRVEVSYVAISQQFINYEEANLLTAMLETC
jgi:hypothetical protein